VNFATILGWLLFLTWFTGLTEYYVPPKRRFTYGLHSVISQKMATFVTTAVRTSNPSKSMENICLRLCTKYVEDKFVLRSALKRTAMSRSLSNIKCQCGGTGRHGLAVIDWSQLCTFLPKDGDSVKSPKSCFYVKKTRQRIWLKKQIILLHWNLCINAIRGSHRKNLRAIFHIVLAQCILVCSH
jgi:hypothetical protein